MKKLLLIALSALALFGCGDDDEKEVKVIQEPVVVEAPVVQPVIVQQPVIIQQPFQIQHDYYSLDDVERHYLMCLVVNGVDEDDYCERQCADVFDYDSCDYIEDLYEKPEESKTYNTIFINSQNNYYDSNNRREGNWIKYSNASCNVYPYASSIENGKSFTQTKTCFDKYHRDITYNDGFSTKEYKQVEVSKRSYTLKGTKTTAKPLKESDKYSSNLIHSDKLKASNVPKKTEAVQNVDSTSKSQSSAQHSSNLLSSDKLKPVTPKVTEPIQNKANSNGSSSAQYSSNLLSSDKLKPVAPKTTEATQNTAVSNSSSSAQYSSNLLSSDKLKTGSTSETTESPTADIVEPTTAIPTEALLVGGGVAAAAAASKLNNTDKKSLSNNKTGSDIKKETTKTKPVVKPKPVTIVSKGSWKDSGKPYSCGSWSPSRSSVKKNKSFRQTASCKQKQVQTIKFSDGSKKTETKVVSVRESRTEYGTKANSSSSYSSSKSKSKSKYKK